MDLDREELACCNKLNSTLASSRCLEFRETGRVTAFSVPCYTVSLFAAVRFTGAQQDVFGW